MVTQQKLLSSAIVRYRLGTVLVWLGVLVWLPFILLRFAGESPSFLIFLPFHLVGVIGGARIRSAARNELGMKPKKRSVLHLAGHLLIFLGILVWAPYVYLKVIQGEPVDVMDFLPYHLTGVLGGVVLHLLNYLLGRYATR